MSVAAMESHRMNTVLRLQIFAVILVELSKSENCNFSFAEPTLQKISVSRKYKSSQEISTKLCQMVC